MPSLTIEYRHEAERLLLEQAVAYATHLHRVAQQVPDGTVLAACEQLALTEGRALLRNSLAAALEGRIRTAEQKGGPPAPANRRTPAGARDATPARS